MKKITAILLAVLLICTMAFPAAAVTPKMNIKVPQISNIKFDVKLPEGVAENAVKSWLAEHPIQLPKFKIPAWGD